MEEIVEFDMEKEKEEEEKRNKEASLRMMFSKLHRSTLTSEEEAMLKRR
jgi:hypothetical protein